jgi:hypothetical protein
MLWTFYPRTILVVRFLQVFVSAFVQLNLREKTEQTFGFFILVSAGIWPGSNRRFSPGWNHQPGLKSSIQWIVQQTFAVGTFSLSLWFVVQTRSKGYLLILVGITNRDQRNRWPFIPGFGSNRGYRLIF